MTQREVAKLLGVSKSTPGAWEAGRANVREVLLSRIAEVLQTSEAWLRTGREDQREPRRGGGLRPDEQLLLVAYNALPPPLRRLLVNWAEAVGEALNEAPEPHATVEGTPPAPPPLRLVGELANRADDADGNEGEDEDELAEVVPIRLLGDIAAGLPAQAWRQGDEVPVPTSALESLPRGVRAGVLKVSGDSMEPTIAKGALILVREASFGEYRKGDIVVALIDGEETTLKRYGGQRRGVITLRADNPAYEDQRFAPGRVVVQAVMLANLSESGTSGVDPQSL